MMSHNIKSSSYTNDRLEVARGILLLFKGWLVPLGVRSKAFNKTLSIELRNIQGWKHDGDKTLNHPNAYYNRPVCEAELFEMFKLNPNLNLGGFTGEKSGVYLLDIDHPAAIDIDRILAAVSPDFVVPTLKGFHIYGSSERPLPTSRIPSVGDFRGDGGFVLVPPSVQKSGVVYEFASGVPAADTLPPIDPLLEIVCPKTLTLPLGSRTPPTPHILNVLGHFVDVEGVVDATGQEWQAASLRERVATLLNSNPMIQGLLKMLGVADRRTKNLSCPYHPPDHHASMAVANDGRGYAFFDYHSNDPEGYEIVSVVQLYADLKLGFIGGERLGNNRHWVFNKSGHPTIEANIWLARLAIETRAVKSEPPSTLKPEGFTTSEKQILDAISLLFQCRELVFPVDPENSPLSWSWVARWTFLGAYQQQPSRRAALEKRVGRALHKAMDKGYVVRVAEGSGWKEGEARKAAIYRPGTELDVQRVKRQTGSRQKSGDQQVAHDLLALAADGAVG